MNRLDVLASERVYLDHLLPLATGISGAQLRTPMATLTERAKVAGLEPGRMPYSPDGPPVLVASYRDANLTPSARRLALLEHGAGQGYAELVEHPGYSGGSDWGRASLILAPGPHAALRWRTAYPLTPVVELGGSPRLDRFAGASPWMADRPVVAFSFHWWCRLSPEASKTWPRWIGAIRDLAHSGRYRVLGHAHPRAWDELSTVWRRADILGVPDFTDVLERADLYVCDNSSTMYEFAALGRPVLCLDSFPPYRREISHGLRFWDYPPGLSISEPDQLAKGVAAALEDGPEARQLRHAAVMEAYGQYLDGRATERALEALDAWLG